MARKDQILQRKLDKANRALRLLNVVENIQQWGYNKGIIQAANPMAQWTKTQEEVNELKDAIEKNDRDAIVDAIGDVIVTVVLQAKIQNIDLTETLESVYDIVSKRKGKLVNGTFIKES